MPKIASLHRRSPLREGREKVASDRMLASVRSNFLRELPHATSRTTVGTTVGTIAGAKQPAP
jgi:hypothetical protein